MNYRDVLAAFQSLVPAKQLALVETIGDGVAFDNPDGLRVTARSRKELRRLVVRRADELHAWIRTFESGDVFYDIGANCGGVTLAAAAAHRERVRIVAFEPSYSSFESLVRNLSGNQLLGIVVPLQVALLDRTGLEPMHYLSTAAGTSLHGIGRAVNHLEEPFVASAVQLVPTFTLDDLAASLRLPPPTRIKIDVDGHEEPVLRGAVRTLSQGTVLQVFVEISDHDRQGTRPRAIEAFMRECSYELTDRLDHRTADGEPSRVSDYVFQRLGGPRHVVRRQENESTPTGSEASDRGADPPLHGSSHQPPEPALPC